MQPFTEARCEVGTAQTFLGSAPTGQDFLNQVIPISPMSNIQAINVTVPGSDAANLSSINDALKGLTQVAVAIGALQTGIDTQRTFNGTLSDALTAGIGSLVDADMNVATTRLQALQTQQQLGIQSLSIANQNTQLVMKLFGATA